jgi:tRNA-2-methylthio-N6-dimethylallyladenosine synthase
MQAVHATGEPKLIGSLLPATIVAAGSNSLAGRIAGEDAREAAL